MRYKRTVVGMVVLLACLASWLANNAAGQPEPARTGGAADQVVPPLPPVPKSNPPRNDLSPTKEESDLIRAYQEKYATKAPSAPANPAAPSGTKPAAGLVHPSTPSAKSATPAPPRPAGPAHDEHVLTTKDIPPVDAAAAQFSDNPSGRQEPAVSLEWVGPPMVKLGQPAPYEIMVKNISSIPVTQVLVRVRVPVGVSVQATDPKPLQEAGMLIWDVGTLQPHQERRLHLHMLPNVRGDLACQALVSFTGLSTARIRVREPRLLVKATGPEKVLMGDMATITLTVSNPGDGPADHVKIRATLSEGLEHAHSKTFEFDLGNLGAAESRSVQLVCGTKMAGLQTCDAVATAEGNLHVLETARVEVILPRLDIVASGPKLRYLDRHATYTFKVSNPGSAPASNVIVSDVIPEGFKFLSASNGGRHDAGTRTVSWFIGDLTSGQSREVSAEVVAVGTGLQKHLASVVAARGLKSETDVQTRVEGLSALLMELADLDDPVEVGADTAYEIRVTNTGSKTETNLQLICTIPDKMEFRGARGAADGRFRVQEKEIVFESLPKLAPKADAVYRVNVRGTAPGDLRFRARITADGLTEPVMREESTKVYGDEVIK